MTETADRVFFVLRSPLAGLTGKQVRRLSGPSVLAWFQQLWQGDDHEGYLKDTLGAELPDLAALLAKVRELDLPAPTSMDELSALVREHLGAEAVRAGEHALRVRTRAEDVELAYYWLDEDYVHANPGQADFLLHADWALPSAFGSAPFKPLAPVEPLGPAGGGEGATYLVIEGALSQRSGYVIEGVRLGGLCQHLMTLEPKLGSGRGSWLTSWPIELRVLRARADSDLDATLRRVNGDPVGDIARVGGDDLATGPLSDARAELDALVTRLASGASRAPEQSRVMVADHVAKLSLNVQRGPWVFHQWVLFDDRWAGRHPDLANGLLRYVNAWDATPDPSFDDLCDRGSRLRVARRYADSIRSFDAALRLRPDSHWALTARARVQRLRGDLASALADLDRALELKPGYRWALQQRGETLRLEHDYDGARADFDHLLAFEPDDAFALSSRGDVHRVQKRYHRAIEDLTRALKIDRKSAWSWAIRGEVHRLLGSYSEALEDLGHALELAPKDARSWRWRAWTHLEVRRFKDALADVERAIALDPKSPLAYDLRAEALEVLGRPEDALADIEQAIELKPHSERLKTVRDRLLSKVRK